MKKTRLSLRAVLSLVVLLFAVAAGAVHPAVSEKKPPQNLSMRQFSESSNAELETLLGKKLSWKDRIVLKILKKKLRKAIQENPAFGEVPMGNHLLSPCSKIKLHSGEIIEADILQITDARVVYRRCGRPNSPEIDISKGDVASIENSDGKIVFQDSGNEDYAYRDTGYSEPETDKTAVWALVCAITGIFFFPVMIVGVILGLQSLKKIRRNPGRYKGEGLATAAVVIGCVYGALILLAIALLVAAFS